MSSVKTIIFDFGNVLFDLDFKGCYQNFKNLLNIEWEDNDVPAIIQSANDRLERGEINEETFIWQFQQINNKANPRDILKAWNSLLVGFPKERFSLLESLRKDYQLVLLSNINSIHEAYIHQYFASNFNLLDFEERYFDFVFYSHHIGMRKPEERIYEHVTQSIGAHKEEILFIDDNEANILAAKKFGWQAVLHDPTSDIVFNVYKYLGL